MTIVVFKTIKCLVLQDLEFNFLSYGNNYYFKSIGNEPMATNIIDAKLILKKGRIIEVSYHLNGFYYIENGTTFYFTHLDESIIEEYFAPLGEWRDQKIDEILNEI